MLWSLVVLAPLSLIASDLPRAVAWPLAVAATAWAIIDARRYRSMAVRQLTIPAGRGAATCDGERIDGLRAHWRDRHGHRHRASFWPDTLPAGMRRELKIAMQRREAASDRPSMAG